MPYNDEASHGAPGYYAVSRFDATIDVERVDDDEEEDSSSNGSGWQNGKQCETRSNGSDSSSSVMALPSRNPTCALCKNHRISSPLKGHKRYCPFGRCQCDLCRVTRRKQKLNASQVAIRRAIQQDKELGIERPAPIPPPVVNVVSAPPPRIVYSPAVPSMDPRPMAVAAAAAARFTSERLHYESGHQAAFAHQHQQPQHQHQQQQQANSPVVFGENMSLECVLLGRSASLLMNALTTSRLTHEQLVYLNHEIASAIRILTEEVTPHLNDIYRYLMDRLQREQAKNGAKTSFQGCIVNQLPPPTPLAEISKPPGDAAYTGSGSSGGGGGGNGGAPASNHIQQPVRESVIFPPIDVSSFPVYPQYGSQ